MNFYISKIRLWFEKGENPRDLEFEADKVNVITGDSSTGKSSVLKIIDYCLLAERSTIVRDVINENVSWYGLVFCIEEQKYTIIRQAPKLDSAEMTVIFKEGDYLPNEPQAGMNDTRPRALVKMNELFHIPSKMKLEGKKYYQFRHNLVFNYLTEDIIATENTYQDLRFFRLDEYAIVLNDLFKMAIGVNELKLRALESELQKAQKEESRKKIAQEKEQQKFKEYQHTREEITKQIDELGLGEAVAFGDNPIAWAENVKVITENCNLQFKNEQANYQRNQIEMELRSIGEKLSYFESLETEFKTYQRRLERQDSSLMPLEYVKRHLSELMTYQETGRLLRELTEAWQAIKNSYMPEVKLPANFDQVKKELQQRDRELRSEWKRLNPYNIEQRDIVWIRKAILLAEKIERELSNIPKQTVTDEMVIACGDTINTLNEKLTRLKAKNGNALGNLNDSIEKYFRWQRGISESYRDYKPLYSMEEKMLMLEREKGEYPESNVGSKSNYMFLHLCYFYGLHDLLMSNGNEQIPQFLFIDQPSIPYYADKNEHRNADDDEMISNDDQERLREAFNLTDKFMKEMLKKGHFQIILVEHARPEYWQDLDSFVTRYEFRRGDGLIPANVINKQND